ncbi:hypothetical protein OAA26_00460 [bacterium]|nr:hypothetical protein [bacterium]
MTWYYEDKIFEPTDEDLTDLVGFVYEIEELSTGKKYIGKKFFWKPKILPVTKTRKRRKRTKVQSDWQKYFGSSEMLKERVAEGGIYHRTILRLCSTKGQCSYYEAKLQFEYDVLLRDDYYNEFIGCKIHSKHL